jgi:hypothetical protein
MQAIVTLFVIINNEENNNVMHALPGRPSHSKSILEDRVPLDIFNMLNTNKWDMLLTEWLLETHAEEQPPIILIPIFTQHHMDIQSADIPKTIQTGHTMTVPTSYVITQVITQDIAHTKNFCTSHLCKCSQEMHKLLKSIY